MPENREVSRFRELSRVRSLKKKVGLLPKGRGGKLASQAKGISGARILAAPQEVRMGIGNHFFRP